MLFEVPRGDLVAGEGHCSFSYIMEREGWGPFNAIHIPPYYSCAASYVLLFGCVPCVVVIAHC